MKTSFSSIVDNYYDSDEVLFKLIEVGGRDLVMEVSTFDYASANYASDEVLFKLIEVGGKELIMEKNLTEYSKEVVTSLYSACEHQASSNLILKLIEVGWGQEPCHDGEV